RITPDHLAAERLDQRLMSEADPQDRRPCLRERADRLDRDPGLLRGAGAWRDDQAVGLQPEQLRDGRLVVPDDPDITPQLAQVLDQVVGEGVVVVDDEHVHGHSCCSAASSTARKTAFALLTDSLYSYAGWASATVPPPACTWPSPSLTTTVRMW